MIGTHFFFFNKIILFFNFIIKFETNESEEKNLMDRQIEKEIRKFNNVRSDITLDKLKIYIYINKCHWFEQFVLSWYPFNPKI